MDKGETSEVWVSGCMLTETDEKLRFAWKGELGFSIMQCPVLCPL